MEEINKMIKENLESIIAASALLVSIISVILTLVTIRSSRKHNRLSVRPICVIHPVDYEDMTTVSIQNKGTGPLLISEMAFTNFETGVENRHLIDHMPDLPEAYLWNNFTKALHPVLYPGESKVLIDFRGNMADPQYITLRDSIRNALSRIDAVVKYTSVYDEKKPFETMHRLSWFSRNL